MSSETVANYFIVPQIGEVANAEVGDALYKEGIKTVHTTYRVTIKEPGSINMGSDLVLKANVGVGGELLYTGDRIPTLCIYVKTVIGLAKMFGSDDVIGCLVDRQKNQAFDGAAFLQKAKVFPATTPIAYDLKKTEKAVETPSDFHVDVLYQGVSKGEVKLSYREFSGGVARPAFTQDVSYELDKNGMVDIGFKGMRIKILKATSQGLQYILEQPMPSLLKYRTQAAQP